MTGLVLVAAEHAAEAAEHVARLVGETADRAARDADEAVELPRDGLGQARLEEAQYRVDRAARLLLADARALRDLSDQLFHRGAPVLFTEWPRASDEDDGLEVRYVEAPAAARAGEHVVDAHHVVARLGELRLLLLVHAARRLALLCAAQPAHFVVGALAAVRAGVVGALGLRPLVEEVSLVHAAMIADARPSLFKCARPRPRAARGGGGAGLSGARAGRCRA